MLDTVIYGVVSRTIHGTSVNAEAAGQVTMLSSSKATLEALPIHAVHRQKVQKEASVGYVHDMLLFSCNSCNYKKVN